MILLLIFIKEDKMFQMKNFLCKNLFKNINKLKKILKAKALVYKNKQMILSRLHKKNKMKMIRMFNKFQTKNKKFKI